MYRRHRVRGSRDDPRAHTPIQITRAGVRRGLEFDAGGEPVVRFGRGDVGRVEMLVRTFTPFEVRDRDVSG